MIEKVNPMHPDKIADRIAGALVDYAYTQQEAPKIAVEVLIGHGSAHIIAETSVHIPNEKVAEIVERISKEKCEIDYKEVPQDAHLADNQSEEIRCGDNGIFKGMPATGEQIILSRTIRNLYKEMPTDGKFIYDSDSETFIACQSNCDSAKLKEELKGTFTNCAIVVNPLGEWTGGINVDSGATNRKLGSDMADGVTGGGLHGKDLSKADVSVNIVAHMLAEEYRAKVEALCAIGDKEIEFRIFGTDDSFKPYYMDYEEVAKDAKEFIDTLGGFEKLAEWGLY